MINTRETNILRRIFHIPDLSRELQTSPERPTFSCESISCGKRVTLPHSSDLIYILHLLQLPFVEAKSRSPRDQRFSAFFFRLSACVGGWIYVTMEVNSLARDVQNLLNIPDEMEKMLQRPARAYVKQTKALFRTNADILERPDCYQFILDMPGLESEHIKVKVENNVLHVAGKKKKSKKVDPDVKVLRIERRRARYMRKFTLPADANVEDIKATYKDGVLTVTVAKRPVEETPKPATISIPIS